MKILQLTQMSSLRENEEPNQPLMRVRYVEQIFGHVTNRKILKIRNMLKDLYNISLIREEWLIKACRKRWIVQGSLKIFLEVLTLPSESSTSKRQVVACVE